jgi:hypothetical protein
MIVIKSTNKSRTKLAQIWFYLIKKAHRRTLFNRGTLEQGAAKRGLKAFSVEFEWMDWGGLLLLKRGT